MLYSQNQSPPQKSSLGPRGRGLCRNRWWLLLQLCCKSLLPSGSGMQDCYFPLRHHEMRGGSLRAAKSRGRREDPGPCLENQNPAEPQQLVPGCFSLVLAPRGLSRGTYLSPLAQGCVWAQTIRIWLTASKNLCLLQLRQRMTCYLKDLVSTHV